MDAKIRKIYAVELNEITCWNEEENYPADFNPIVEIDNEDPSFYSAHLDQSYRYYRKNERQLDEYDSDLYLELSAISLEIPDKEWKILYAKSSLTYDDYESYIIKDETQEVLAWSFTHGISSERQDDALGELLRAESENFNMRVICEKAGISYSTFRGFKNNHQPFSYEKIYRLLKCMHEIGEECWDDDMEDSYKNMYPKKAN